MIEPCSNPAELLPHVAWKNPTDLPVVFGETTDSEMCFGFVGYYPEIPVHHWVAPSLAAACLPEL